MTSPRPPSPWLWRALALATVAAFAVLVARFWHPLYGFTAFYQLDAASAAAQIDAWDELPVFVHSGSAGYDGLYYAQLAHDPTLRDPAFAHAIDDVPYRARRIFAPALAWLLGAGQPRGILLAYPLLNVIAWLALAALLWRLLDVRDARGWFAWAGVLFSAGVLGSVRLALTDLPAVTLIAASLLAAERWHGRVAVALLAAAALARETAVLAIAGLCKPPWFSRRNLARLVLAAAPLAGWFAYIRWQIGPGAPGWWNFAFPGAGLAEKVRDAFAALTTVDDAPLAWSNLLATLAFVTQAVFFALRRRPDERWWRIGFAHTLLLLALGTAVWEGFPGAVARVLLPLQLAFNVLVHRTRAPLAWLLLGNLSLFSGLLAVRDVPHPANELAAQRLGGSVAIVRFGDNWFGRESAGGHVWLWTGRTGTLLIETHPPTSTPAPLRFEFALRSLVPRTVVVRSAGRELARIETGPELSRHTLALPAGTALPLRLEFETDTPPVPESSAPGARPLAFALYDPRLALAEP